jgi:hypothetical protein
MAPSVAAWPDGFRLDTDSSGDDSFCFRPDLSSALFNAPGLNSALIDSFRRDHPALRTAATISAPPILGGFFGVEDVLIT